MGDALESYFLFFEISLNIPPIIADIIAKITKTIPN